jgi:hypothetical protein
MKLFNDSCKSIVTAVAEAQTSKLDRARRRIVWGD